MILRPYHEIIGVVRDIIVDNDTVKIIFAMEREIELPKIAAPKEITQELRGQRIGIINIDEKYRFRKI